MKRQLFAALAVIAGALAATPASAEITVGVSLGTTGPGSSLGIPYKNACLLYTSPSPRDRTRSRMPSSA